MAIGRMSADIVPGSPAIGRSPAMNRASATIGGTSIAAGIPIAIAALATVSETGNGSARLTIKMVSMRRTIATALLTISFACAGTSVRDFGAKADGVAKDTAAIQRAIDAAAKQGGGTVLVPAGRYLSGT